VPDNELFLDLVNAFDFSKALPVIHKVPKTESNCIRALGPALSLLLIAYSKIL